MRIPLGDDRLDRALAHASDGAEPVANRRSVPDRELIQRVVYVGRLDQQIDVRAFLDEGHHLVGVIHIGG